MKKTWLLYLLFFILITVVFLISCVKTDPNSILNNIPGGTGTNDITPAYTDVGTPVGNPVTKTIGPSGGTIASDDGILQLTIPAGALTVSTDITIQPTTNPCPGGIGLAYDMLPNGTKFAKPASLSFHYTDEDLDSTEPYFLFVAYQDSLGEWLADIVYRDVDTTAKTVTLDINHFTGRAVGSKARCLINPDRVHGGESAFARAVDIIEGSAPNGPGNGDEELSSLGQTNPLPSVSDWRVNGKAGGSSSDGLISGNGSSATYTAPATITKQRNVSVSAKWKSTKTFPIMNRGKVIRMGSTTEYFRVSGKITLLPKFSYRVLVTYQEFGTNECFVDNYTDSATMLVDVDDDVVTISEIENQAPFTDPPTGKLRDGTETCTWLKDPTGEVNIESASGIVFPMGDVASGVTKTVRISMEGSGIKPKWEMDDPPNPVRFYGGNTFLTIPPQFSFQLNNESQVFRFNTPPNASGYSANIAVYTQPRTP